MILQSAIFGALFALFVVSMTYNIMVLLFGEAMFREEMEHHKQLADLRCARENLRRALGKGIITPS